MTWNKKKYTNLKFESNKHYSKLVLDHVSRTFLAFVYTFNILRQNYMRINYFKMKRNFLFYLFTNLIAA